MSDWISIVDAASELHDASSTSSAPTHFDIRYPDTMVMIATVNGGKAERNVMIPLLAKHLRECEEDEDLYEVFVRTNRDVVGENSCQVSEFRSTLRYKLCLRNVSDRSHK